MRGGEKTPPISERKCKVVMESTDVAHMEEVIRELEYFSSGNRNLYDERIDKIIYRQNPEWLIDLYQRIIALLGSWGSSEALGDMNSLNVYAGADSAEYPDGDAVKKLEKEYEDWYYGQKAQIEYEIQLDEENRKSGITLAKSDYEADVKKEEEDKDAKIKEAEQEKNDLIAQIEAEAEASHNNLVKEIERLEKQADEFYLAGNSLDGSAMERQIKQKKIEMERVAQKKEYDISKAKEICVAQIVKIEIEYSRKIKELRDHYYSTLESLSITDKNLEDRISEFEKEARDKKEGLQDALSAYYSDKAFSISSYVSAYYKEFLLADYNLKRQNIFLGRSCADKIIGERFSFDRKNAGVLDRLFADVNRLDCRISAAPETHLRNTYYRHFGLNIFGEEYEVVNEVDSEILGQGMYGFETCFYKWSNGDDERGEQEHHELSIYFGTKEQLENEAIKEIWATVQYRSNVGNYDDGDTLTTSIEFKRVKFEFLRWQNEDVMDDFDEMKLNYENEKLALRETYDKLKAQEEKRLKDQLSKIHATYDGKRDEQLEAHNARLSDFHKKYIATMEAQLVSHNSAVCETLLKDESVEELKNDFLRAKNKALADKSASEIEENYVVYPDIVNKLQAAENEEIANAKRESSKVINNLLDQLHDDESKADTNYQDAVAKWRSDAQKNIRDAKANANKELTDAENALTEAEEKKIEDIKNQIEQTIPLRDGSGEDDIEIGVVGGSRTSESITVDRWEWDALSEDERDNIRGLIHSGNEEIKKLDLDYQPTINAATIRKVNALRGIDDLDEGVNSRGVWVAQLPDASIRDFSGNGWREVYVTTPFDFTVVYDRSRTKIDGENFKKYYAELSKDIEEERKEATS